MKDTLSFHRDRPFTRRMDFSDIPVKAVSMQWTAVQKMLKAEDDGLKTAPEDAALWFYLTNHVMAEISRMFEADEPLGKYEEFVDDYHRRMHLKSLRMFYYLLQIVTRESRHAKVSHGLSKLYDQYPEVQWYHKQIRGGSNPAEMLASDPPNMPLGRYLEFMEKQYTKAGYGGSFGGKPWANITKCLRNFVTGKITAEMMVDTGFTLEHNCGTMFNKGMVYLNAGPNLQKILDVQRSGQIPQYVDSGIAHTSLDMQKYLQSVANLIPGLTGYVDWYLVESLGSVGYYPDEKSAQASLHGEPDNASVNDKIAKWKHKIAAKEAEQKQAQFNKEHFEVMPNVYVKKTERTSA